MSKQAPRRAIKVVEDLIDDLRRIGICLVYDSRQDQIQVGMHDGYKPDIVIQAKISCLVSLKYVAKEVLSNDLYVSINYNRMARRMIGIVRLKAEQTFLCSIEADKEEN